MCRLLFSLDGSELKWGLERYFRYRTNLLALLIGMIIKLRIRVNGGTSGNNYKDQSSALDRSCLDFLSLFFVRAGGSTGRLNIRMVGRMVSVGYYNVGMRVRSGSHSSVDLPSTDDRIRCHNK
jgi:hypothetical protein